MPVKRTSLSMKLRKTLAGAVVPLVPLSPAVAPVLLPAAVLVESCSAQSYPEAVVSDLNGGYEGTFFMRHKDGYTFALKNATLRALPDQSNAPRGTTLVQVSDDEADHADRRNPKGTITSQDRIVMSSDSSIKLGPGEPDKPRNLLVTMTPIPGTNPAGNYSSENFTFKIGALSN